MHTATSIDLEVEACRKILLGFLVGVFWWQGGLIISAFESLFHVSDTGIFLVDALSWIGWLYIIIHMGRFLLWVRRTRQQHQLILILRDEYLLACRQLSLTRAFWAMASAALVLQITSELSFLPGSIVAPTTLLIASMSAGIPLLWMTRPSI